LRSRHTWPVEARPVSAYQELTPPPILAPYVSCLWVQVICDGEEVYDQPVLPDGCIDVVAIGDQALLAGPATSTTTLRLAPGTVTVGVRFRVGAAPALVGASAGELRDSGIPLEEVWGRAGLAIAVQTVEAADWRTRLEILVGGLIGRVGDARTPDPVGVGVASMLTDRPGLPVALVARDLGLSERQLRRRVEDAVGYSPRTLARILRFQRFLRAARSSGSRRQLAVLAADAGYADQAHLTRESRELSGLPPAALLEWEEKRLSG
jgi:AraC-like DNA-binding protein